MRKQLTLFVALCFVMAMILGQANSCQAPDTDADGIIDPQDNCPTLSNPYQTDIDGDRVGDDCDNCKNTSNKDQLDVDADKVGDLCDNCQSNANTDQRDCDKDGLGDVCDSSNKCAIYSQDFVQGQASNAQCTEWRNFKTLILDTYTKVTIKGSYDTTGVSCGGSSADAICKAIKNNGQGSWTCDGRTWTLCNRYEGELWINPPSLCSGSNCPTGYIVRPCIMSSNWGGVNTATCGGPSQNITVICE
jgi:hypothetical protein